MRIKPVGQSSILACTITDDDGQPDLPGGGHAELRGGGQHDYLVSLRPW
jgi:hypothetical protein